MGGITLCSKFARPKINPFGIEKYVRRIFVEKRMPRLSLYELRATKQGDIEIWVLLSERKGVSAKIIGERKRRICRYPIDSRGQCVRLQKIDLLAELIVRQIRRKNLTALFGKNLRHITLSTSAFPNPRPFREYSPRQTSSHPRRGRVVISWGDIGGGLARDTSGVAHITQSPSVGRGLRRPQKHRSPAQSNRPPIPEGLRA